jgi:hypothetical protein
VNIQKLRMRNADKNGSLGNDETEQATEAEI